MVEGCSWMIDREGKTRSEEPGGGGLGPIIGVGETTLGRRLLELVCFNPCMRSSSRICSLMLLFLCS